MNTLRQTLSVSIALACCAYKAWAADTPAGELSSPLSPQVQELKRHLQGKSRDQIHELLIEQLGPVQRFRGSGIRIDVWDFAGGELAFNPAVGPTLTLEGKDRTWLLTTHNGARTNLLGGYEMVTLRAEASGSGRCWLGNLMIETNLSYTFKDSGQFPAKSAQQTNNFFYLHPSGAVDVQYAVGVSDHTLLESLPSDTVIAWLHFRSAEGNARQTFTIVTKEPSRRLVFGASAPLSFEMDKAWENFWE